MTSLLDRLAGLAVRTGPLLVARPRARYEQPIDDQLLHELAVERDAATVAEPRRVVRRPSLVGGEEVPAALPRARTPLDREEPEPIATTEPHVPRAQQPTMPEPRATPPVVPTQTASRPEATPAAAPTPESGGDELVVIVEHAWPDDEPRHRRPAAAPESAPSPAGALTATDEALPAEPASAARPELVRAPAEPFRQRPTVRTTAPTPSRAPTREAEPITVTIGRVELRTVEPSPPRNAAKATAEAAPSQLRFNGPTLDEFLGGLPG